MSCDRWYDAAEAAFSPQAPNAGWLCPFIYPHPGGSGWCKRIVPVDQTAPVDQRVKSPDLDTSICPLCDKPFEGEAVVLPAEMTVDVRRLPHASCIEQSTRLQRVLAGIQKDPYGISPVSISKINEPDRPISFIGPDAMPAGYKPQAEQCYVQEMWGEEFES